MSGCTDIPGSVDYQSFACGDLTTAAATAAGFRCGMGLTADKACCACGGGLPTPPPPGFLATVPAFDAIHPNCTDTPGWVDDIGHKCAVYAHPSHRRYFCSIGKGRVVGHLAPGQDLRALLMGDLDVAEHPFLVQLGCQRPHFRRRVEGVAKLDRSGQSDKFIKELVGNLFM